MANWQELFDMLLDESLSARDIVDRLAVKPYRLRQLLDSPRLMTRLRLLELVANKKADHMMIASTGSAASKLAILAGNGQSETARRACLDVLERGVAMHKKKKADASLGFYSPGDAKPGWR